MKKLILAGCLSLLSAQVALAESSAPASVAVATSTDVIAPNDRASTTSIEQLMTITQSEKMMDTVKTQSHTLWKQMIQQMIDQKQINPQRQDDMALFLNKLEPKFVTIMDQNMSWDKLKPLLIQIYQDSFTQKEIDDQIAFYNTPSGQSMIQKMPIVMQRSMTVMQQQYAPMMQQMAVAIEETINETSDDKKSTTKSKTTKTP